MLIAMAGLSGTGKTTIANTIAPRLNASLLNKDIIRAAVFGSDVDYTTEQNNVVGQMMFLAAEYLLRKDPSRVVILDARTFSRRYQVDELRAFAARVNTPLRIIECVASDDLIRARLEKDAREGTHLAADRDFNMYARMKANFEVIDPPKLLLDTGVLDLEMSVRKALDYITGGEY